MYRFLAIVGLALAALWQPTAAKAGIEFAAYEGPDAVRVGTGGAKLVENGLDIWTEGNPPRRYQVLGFFTDERSNSPLSGKAYKSRSVADRVRALGGNALIIVERNSEDAGITAVAGPYGMIRGIQRKRITTLMQVVRYLDQPNVDGSK
jgi:hypothetical protein